MSTKVSVWFRSSSPDAAPDRVFYADRYDYSTTLLIIDYNQVKDLGVQQRQEWRIPLKSILMWNAER